MEMLFGSLYEWRIELGLVIYTKNVVYKKEMQSDPYIKNKTQSGSYKYIKTQSGPCKMQSGPCKMQLGP
jgi:hypothetical protein